MKLFLVDLNPDLAYAWQDHFDEFPGVSVLCGNILEVAENTIVSPANSYGFMDGGIDRQYTDYFGLRHQTEIQAKIALRREGYLPVGTAVLVKTGHPKIPFMIAAPTMETPGPVSAVNCFFTMSAVLNVAYANREIISKVYCPGLATGTGRVAPEIAAREMGDAYRKWLNKITEIPPQNQKKLI